MAEEKSVFNSSIKRIFDSWMVMKLAVEHNFRGGNSTEVALWMVDAVEQWFSENKDIDPYEVEELLEGLLSNELNTVADDGSIPQVAAHICGCYNLIQQGNLAQVEVILNRLPRLQTTQCARAAQDDSSSDEDEEDDMEQASTSQASHSVQHQAAPQQSEDVEMEEDDGWTTVKKKGKR